MAVKGMWGIGKWKIPDFGITELFGLWENPLVKKAQAAGLAGPTPVPTPTKAPASSSGTTTLFWGGEGGPPIDMGTPEEFAARPNPPAGFTKQTGRPESTQSPLGEVKGVQNVQPPPQPSSGGGGRSLDALVNAMVQRGGYDPTTARAVASADFDRFWREFMSGGDQGGSAVEDYARAQEEAERQAALHRWEETKAALDAAKQRAKDLLDWAVEAVTKQKKPQLERLSAEEKLKRGELERQKQEEQRYYSRAKQDVLRTYRDLSLKSERIMRGMGMADSSRALEAQLKLQRLMAKDISEWSAKEVAAMEKINDRLQYITDTYSSKREEIENEAAAKIAKAQRDYEDEVRRINNAYLLNDNQKAEAIEAARVNAERLIANAKIERENRKQELEQWLAMMKLDVDNLINQNLTDIPELASLRQRENLISQYTLTPSGNVVQRPPLVGYRTPTRKDEEDLLIQSLFMETPEAAPSAKPADLVFSTIA